MSTTRWAVGSALVLVTLGFAVYYSWPSKRERADRLIWEAEQGLSKGDKNENTRLLEDAARLDPSNPRVWWKLCEGYQFTGELNLAVAACHRNIELHPSPLSYNSLGLVYLDQKDYFESAKTFEIAAQNSEDPDIYKNLVWALLVSRQYEKALPAAQRLADISAPDPANQGSAYQLLGIIYLKLGQKAKAEESFDKLRKLNPDWNYRTCELTTDNKNNVHLVCHN
jgi:tetratricopeptide (TPR) repeat protein